MYITLALIKINFEQVLDLYLIFENIVPSRNVPFIRYHSKNHKNFVKIYTKVSKSDKEHVKCVIGGLKCTKMYVFQVKVKKCAMDMQCEIKSQYEYE